MINFMKKLNRKGFVLAEAIVVAVFVLGMFTYLAVNIIPLITKYDQALKYDNPQEVYAANILMDEIVAYYNNYSSTNYWEAFDYRFLDDTSSEYKENFRKYFDELKKQLNVEKLEFDKYESGNYKKECIFTGDRSSRQYCEYLLQKQALKEPGSNHTIGLLCSDGSYGGGIDLSYQSVLVKFNTNVYSKFDILVFKEEDLC